MTRLRQQEGLDEWRLLGGCVTAWFDASSLTASAVLAGRIADLAGDWDVDLRASGVRVRFGTADLTPAEVRSAREISAAAKELGLVADPSALQLLQLGIDSADPASVVPFWQSALAFEKAGDSLVDPLRREPSITFHHASRPSQLRNRIHVDVGRIPEAVEAVKSDLGQPPYGAYELTLKDADGNEIDLVPGGELSEGSDWRVPFSGMTFYSTNSPAQAAELATTVAALADAAGWPLLIDLRPAGVTLDTGKDQWENDEPAFAALAAKIQSAARALGLTADPTQLRFVQLGIDAVDIPAVQAFWVALLGYQRDGREGVTDIYDPRRLNPPMMFQQLDPADPRRHHRDRLRLALQLPHDQAAGRITAAIEAGGKLLPDGSTLTDPEGKEVALLILDR